MKAIDFGYDNVNLKNAAGVVEITADQWSQLNASQRKIFTRAIKTNKKITKKANKKVGE